MIVKTYKLPNGATVRVHDDMVGDRDRVALEQRRAAQRIVAEYSGKGPRDEQQTDTDSRRG